MAPGCCSLEPVTILCAPVSKLIADVLDAYFDFFNLFNTHIWCGLSEFFENFTFAFDSSSCAQNPLSLLDFPIKLLPKLECL